MHGRRGALAWVLHAQLLRILRQHALSAHRACKPASHAMLNHLNDLLCVIATPIMASQAPRGFLACNRHSQQRTSVP